MAQFSMTLTPNHRVMVRVRFKVGKVRKPYPNFQMVPLSMTLSDLWPTFQGHDNIQRPITRLTVSRVWSVQWFCFQWPWVTLNVDFKVTEMPSTNCVRIQRLKTYLFQKSFPDVLLWWLRLRWPRNNICYSGHVKYFSDWLIELTHDLFAIAKFLL